MKSSLEGSSEMYFVVLWNHPKLASRELSLYPYEIVFQTKELMCFRRGEHISVENGESLLSHAAAIVKRWVVHKKDEFEQLLEGVTLLWTNSNELWMLAKKQFGLKRFKLTELKKSDLDVKQTWKEIIDLWRQQLWVVKWRQEIDLPAMIDFDKPVNGMQIWMMPAKLTKILVTLAKGAYAKKNSTPFSKQVTIWDPFCWFWTTWFVVNALWDHFIWSDINIQSAKQNKKWWMGTQYVNTESHFTLFKHDVTKKFTQPFLDHVDMIVTEWWLWPVVKHWTIVRGEWREVQTSDSGKKAQNRKIIVENIKKIWIVYEWFFTNIRERGLEIPIIITVPHYTTLDDDPIYESLDAFLTENDFTHRSLAIYKRKGQLVGRRVLLVNG